MEQIEKIIKSKYTPYIIILILSIVIMIPLFTMNLSEYNEARIHIGRIVGVKEILAQKIFPSFINSKHMLGFGYALNIFYGPLTTYIPILLSYITNSGIIALKVFTLITVFLSGITMYNFIYEISKSKKIALISSLIYILAPYKLTDIYSRNAVGEYTSFIFIPLVFSGIYKLLNNNKKQAIYIITGAVGLILSHTITTIYVAIFALLYLLLNYEKINLKIIKKMLIDGIIIILLTAFYLIPLVEHKTYGNYTIYDSESMLATGADVYMTGIGIKEWASSEFGKQEIVFSLGIAIILGLILTPFVIKKAKNEKEYISFWVLALISAYLSTKLFPWVIMPNFLTIIQFAWRLNGFLIFFISYICAVNVVEFSKVIKDKKNILTMVMIICISICAWLGVARYISKYDYEIDNKFETNLIKAKTRGPYNINREYLPLNAGKNIKYMEERENKTCVVTGEAVIKNEEKQALIDNMEIEVAKKATLELPYIYYHGYTVKLNNKQLKTYQSEKGFLCVDVEESGKLEVEYTGTIVEKMGYVISGISLAGVVVYGIINKSQNRNFLKES